MMVIKHLGDTKFEIIIDSFLKAFENYYVEMPTDINYYKERWKAAKVNLDLSFGMFDNDNLIGFIINAIDYRNGEYVAFNTGTGVLPKYRGQRIVKSIYNYAFPILKASGITKCGLEVITKNTLAIRAYEGIGFKKCKHLICVQGNINVDKFDSVTLIEIAYEDINWKDIPNQNRYTWDFHHAALERGNYKFVKVYNNNKFESFFAIHPERCLVAQFEVLEESPRVWERLLSAISTYSKSIKINNIDDTLVEKLQAIYKSGLQNSVNQFEMEMSLLD